MSVILSSLSTASASLILPFFLRRCGASGCLPEAVQAGQWITRVAHMGFLPPYGHLTVVPRVLGQPEISAPAAAGRPGAGAKWADGREFNGMTSTS